MAIASECWLLGSRGQLANRLPPGKMPSAKCSHLKVCMSLFLDILQLSLECLYLLLYFFIPEVGKYNHLNISKKTSAVYPEGELPVS